MNFAENCKKHKQSGWLALAGVGLISTLALTGCDRSEKETADTTTAQESEPVATDVQTQSVPVVACDDPMVLDRLKLVLQSTLNQKVQGFAGSYANQADITVDSGEVSGRVRNVLIDIQNPSVLQSTTSSGMTTCQASVSMTLPSQDLYQANQVYAAAGRPSLQDRLAEQNIRLNNNMLVDDGFSYVVGQQDGSVKTRIAGQPVILELISDVMASALVQSSIDARRAAINAQRAQAQQERRAQQARNTAPEESRIRQPRPVEPTAPTRPAAPATPTPRPAAPAPQTNAIEENKPAAPSAPQANSSSSNIDTSGNKNLKVPTDDSIDMVIIEDESATY